MIKKINLIILFIQTNMHQDSIKPGRISKSSISFLSPNFFGIGGLVILCMH